LANEDKSAHKQILKATGIVGGAQVISILIRIIRTKIIAVLLGPAGVGIAGLYNSTLDLVHSAIGLGLDFSAVRDVAEAAGTGDQARIGRTIRILRRWVWLTGLLGLAVLVLFRVQFSQYAFKDSDHAIDFVMLAVVPLFSALSGGQMAMLRGIRRIGDMARAGVLGAASGLFITVPFYWLMGIKGIVPALIFSALAELGLSWYFARRVKVVPIALTLRETVTGGAGMIRLGLFTVITGLAATGTMYLVRIFIAGKLGVDGVGQFQAAWNLSAIYVGLVLGAMGADYFPRLSAVNQDNVHVCRLVNEQTEIALLLAGPLIVGMICFMDIIVSFFYSSKFGQSIDILLWQTMGNLLKVISWPIGFVLLAKNRGGLYIFTELLWNGLTLSTIWWLWDRSKLESTGIAFLTSYIALVVIYYLIDKRLCSFSWSEKNKKMILVFVLLTLLAFVNVKYQSLSYWRFVSMGLLAAAIFFSYWELKKIIDLKMVIAKVLQKMGYSKFGHKGE
jgi:O-antigen/teichoic acid export membrane protein